MTNTIPTNKLIDSVLCMWEMANKRPRMILMTQGFFNHLLRDTQDLESEDEDQDHKLLILTERGWAYRDIRIIFAVPGHDITEGFEVLTGEPWINSPDWTHDGSVKNPDTSDIPEQDEEFFRKAKLKIGNWTAPDELDDTTIRIAEFVKEYPAEMWHVVKAHLETDHLEWTIMALPEGKNCGIIVPALVDYASTGIEFVGRRPFPCHIAIEMVKAHNRNVPGYTEGPVAGSGSI